MECNQAYNVVKPQNTSELSENLYELVDAKELNALEETSKKKKVGGKQKDEKCKDCVIVFTAVLALLIAIVAIIIAVVLSTTQAQSMYQKIILEVEMNNNVIANLQNTSQTQHDSLTQEVQILREQILTIHPGTITNPASSCKYISVGSPSGQYWLRNITNNSIQVYCEMEQRSCSCDTAGGWMRVANLDMTDPSQQCPDEFRQVNRTTAPLRTCGRPGPAGCVSTTFPVHGIEYSRVCGRINAYQVGSPDAFYAYEQVTIDGFYADGILLTHGQMPNKHIWTFVAALIEANNNNRVECPCNSSPGAFTGTIPPFISDDYFCDTALRKGQEITDGVLYPDDPLWDGEGCGGTSTCCEFNNPPWFCKQLPQATTDDIELRICGDESTDNEDVHLENVSIYVQ